MSELEQAIKQSFVVIQQLFNEEQLADFRCCSYSELYGYHFGLGTWIRNNLLNADSVLFALFVRGGITQQDEMSSLLITLFYLYLNTQ